MKKIFSLLLLFSIFFFSYAQNIAPGSTIEVRMNNGWIKGTVSEVKDGKYKVLVKNGTTNTIEWVTADKIRAVTKKPNVPIATPPIAAVTETQTIPNSSSPKAGLWEATVTNGYKGDVITFVVSANGKQVEQVEFTGYWQNRRRTIEILKDLDPPNPFAISNMGFGAVQQVPASAMWWEFTGTFTSATTAEGTYRATFAGGDNDTYKLKWTAKKK